MTALKNLFVKSSDRKQAVPVRQAPRPRMQVEALDDRIMPAVTTSLNAGLLSIVGDASSDKVKVSYLPAILNSPARVTVSDLTNNRSFNYVATNVQRIEFRGNAGNDNFQGTNTPIPVKLYGGDGHDNLYGGISNDWFDGGFGNDELFGSAGNDYFLGSAGKDTYHGEDGSDLVFRNGYNPAWDGGNGKDVALGLNRAMTDNSVRLTQWDFDQVGDLTASVSGNLVTITGPSGIGIQLVGTWRTEPDRIVSTGDVTMKTAIGDMKVASASSPIRISLDKERYRGLLSDVPGYANFDSYGVVGNILWSGLPLSTTAGPLKDFADKTGINITMPGVSWGIKLGSDLGHLLAPTNAAVPYLYLSTGTNFSVNYGGVGYGPSISGGTNYLTVLADLNDPFMYVKVNEFAVAGSLKGQIPFDPWAAPDGETQKIYGNLYGYAGVGLSAVPINLSGNVVVDLDANDDGVWAGVSNQTVSQIIKNPIQSANAIMTDIAFGVNGNVELGYSLAGFNIGIPLANGSLLYRPGNFSFRAATPDPFANTPMASYLPSVKFDMQGWIRNWGRDWNVEAHAGASSFAGLNAGKLDLVLNNTGVTVDANVTALAGIGRMNVRGWISSTGDFGLTGNTSFNMDIGIGEVQAAANVSFVRQNGTIKFEAAVSARVEIGSDDWNVFGELDFNVSATLGSTGFRFTGSGRAELGITLAGDESSFDLGFSISNNGFRLDLPLLTDDLVVRW
jgi:hypothetical protein